MLCFRHPNIVQIPIAIATMPPCALLQPCHLRLSMLSNLFSCARAADRQCLLYKQSVGCRKLKSHSLKANYCGKYSERIRLSEPSNGRLVASIRNGQSLHARNLSVRASGSDDDRAELDPRGAGDKLVLCISQDAEVSVLSLVATEVVREAQQRHKAAPTAIAALGRALMGTLLLGALKGDAETVQVTFLGDGPLGQMTSISSVGTFVKGFVGNPLCQPPLKDNGRLDVGSAVGSGVLSVVRNHTEWKQPYTGTIPIYSGEVAEDIAHYLADSEQMNTALGLGVAFDRASGIRFAGGFLVQVLPFCSEETVTKLEDNILKMQPISEAPSDLKASDIVEALLDGIGVGDYNETVVPRYGPCGVEQLKPRMMRAVASLGQSDVQKILNEQGSVEVRCEFCCDVVQFREADLEHVLQSTT